MTSAENISRAEALLLRADGLVCDIANDRAAADTDTLHRLRVLLESAYACVGRVKP